VPAPPALRRRKRVERIYYRDNPIIAGAPPLRPINWSNFTNYVHLWEHLERSGITDVAGVWGFYNGLLTVVSLRQRYAGHAKQALITAAGFRHGDMKTYYVTVDDDIDPTNQDEVLWAMCTRVDPTTAVDVVRDAWTADLDPRVSPARREAGDLTVGRMLINACKPFTAINSPRPTCSTPKIGSSSRINGVGFWRTSK
jgi:UbiD family decarboxylase